MQAAVMLPRALQCFVRLRWAAAWAIFAGMALTAFAVKPDYAAARAFGYELQLDCAQRKFEAVRARLNEDAVMNRIMASFDVDERKNPKFIEVWEEKLFPEFCRSLEQASRRRLLFSRVLSLEGARYVEFECLGSIGNAQLLRLRLHEGPDGEVSIEDYSLSGGFLECTARIRQTLLAQGISSTVNPGPEDLALELESRSQVSLIRGALHASSSGDMKQALATWNGLSDALKETAFWKDVRTAMAESGYKPALQEIEAEVRARKPGCEPYVRYTITKAMARPDEALEALEVLQIQTQGAPIVRQLKAETLISMGRPEEAWKLARETYELNPLVWSSYLTAVKAAVSGGRNDRAMETLQAYSRIISAASVDEQVSAITDLEGFRRSADYKAWLKQTQAAEAAREIKAKKPS